MSNNDSLQDKRQDKEDKVIIKDLSNEYSYCGGDEGVHKVKS